MSDSGQTRKRGGSEHEPEKQVEHEETTREETAAEARDVLDDVDELLDEIDDVLEENAEEFVRGYVQKGGE